MFSRILLCVVACFIQVQSCEIIIGKLKNQNSYEQVQLQARNNRDVDIELLLGSDRKGNTILHHASETGNASILEEILRHHTDESGSKVFKYFENEEAAEIFINKENELGQTAVSFTFNLDEDPEYQFPLAHLLMMSGANPKSSDLIAAISGHDGFRATEALGFIEDLAKDNEDYEDHFISTRYINFQNSVTKDTALHAGLRKAVELSYDTHSASILADYQRACSFVFNLLRYKKHGFEHKDKDGNTPLHIAVQEFGKDDCVSTMFTSIERNSVDCSEWILKTNNEGLTALQLAKERGQTRAQARRKGL